MDKGIIEKDRIKAIPTVYRGVHFQSRLEARWALSFDLCGALRMYEPKIFDLGDKIYYKPDFLLKGVKGYPELYCEVKGVMDPGSLKKINGWLLGDMKTRKKSVKECLNLNLSHGWQMDYPVGEAEVIRSLLVLGKIPLPQDVDRLDQWVQENYPRSDYLKGLFYSSRTLKNSRHLKGNRTVFPFPAQGGGIELLDLSRFPYSVGPSRIKRLKEVCYEVASYRFDY